MISVGAKILNDRYALVQGPISTYRDSQTWIAEGNFENYLARIWPLLGSDDASYQRALWDRELRTLYRLSSSPSAEKTLLQIHDAGFDNSTQSFIMLLEGPGYEPLNAVLSQRSSIGWLNSRSQVTRINLWEALYRIAQGLKLLHSQQVLHGNLRPATVFCNRDQGPDSLRLGGFEWSLRLGFTVQGEAPLTWAMPDDMSQFSEAPFSQELDWFSFGILAARILLPLESLGSTILPDRHRAVLDRIWGSSNMELTEIEKSLLIDLLATREDERLANPVEVLNRIREVTEALEGLDRGDFPEGSLIVVIKPHDDNLLRRAEQANFKPNPVDPLEDYDQTNPFHVQRFLNFITGELRHSKIFGVPDQNFFIIAGGILTLKITQFNNTRTGVTNWDVAFCVGTGHVTPMSVDLVTEIPDGSISARTAKDIYTGKYNQERARSWRGVLPAPPPSERTRVSLSRFLDFLRCTNQLDLLFRVERELFRYEIVEGPWEVQGTHFLRVKQSGAPAFCSGFVSRREEMRDFLARERGSNKPDCEKVALTPEIGDDRLWVSIDKQDWWQIEEFCADESILLSRPIWSGSAVPPSAGLLRPYGFLGQLALIRRRKGALDRLIDHAYLLRSILSPGSQYIDTGMVDVLPVPLPPQRIDIAKQSVIQDILRTRPIYCLQGPPGTGKTTLIANLLREILVEDPVAQVLVTAQAHGALDVLRQRVTKVLVEDQVDPFPLAVRLGSREDEGSNDDTPRQTAIRLLERALQNLGTAPSHSASQKSWMEVASELLLTLSTPKEVSNDFVELVKRSASITYCTTSARDLEILAESEQWFDWSVVEEAGKTHAFDLALPLHAGHRWLLIGDHEQLPPFAYEDFRDAIERLDAAMAALEGLPKEGAFLDTSWIQRWRELDAPQQALSRDFFLSWLRTFAHIFTNCSKLSGDGKITQGESVGALAGFLTHQYRMHPSIARLISNAFYENFSLISETEDEEGRPVPEILHHIVKPAEIGSSAIVWLDLPWCNQDRRCRERGISDGLLPYTNPAEVSAICNFLSELAFKDGIDEKLELAIISPYNQQNQLIERELVGTRIPANVLLKEELAKRAVARVKSRVVHTVDSFQGNEADMVIVSMVRNNSEPEAEGLGFLRDPGRANVLLSRAQKLLVIVGSWDFFSYQLRHVQKGDTLWHWKQVLTDVEAMFNTGEAVKIHGRWKADI